MAANNPTHVASETTRMYMDALILITRLNGNADPFKNHLKAEEMRKNMLAGKNGEQQPTATNSTGPAV